MHNLLKQRPLPLWQLVIPLLIASNVAYLTHSIPGSIITLAFFLLVPGYLLLSQLKHGLTSRWAVASLSIGLSLLLLMVGGLALNTLYTFGLDRPLTTGNIFIMLNVLTVGLLWRVRNSAIKLPDIQRIRPGIEEAAFTVALTVLPLLAIGGAIRLNNGGSNILTMVLFALIPLLLIALLWRKNLRHIYPYALFMMALAILFSTSMRGWFIIGHDTFREFQVFQSVMRDELWRITGNPYNACLSIGILPAVLAKISNIADPYIYKAVYPILLSFLLIPVYLIIQKMWSARYALLGGFAFIAFPTFINDLTFLNRQGVALIFFSLLLLVSFSNMLRQHKVVLTTALLAGLVLSHYSSSYVMLAILLIAWLAYKLLTLKQKDTQKSYIPLLSLPILISALLLTFLWNMQITESTDGVKNTATKTVTGLFGDDASRSSFISYGLAAPDASTPEQEFYDTYGEYAPNAAYVPQERLPLTNFGDSVNQFLNVRNLHDNMHAFVARIMQVLLLVGTVVLYFAWRKKRQTVNLYYLALTVACLASLVLMTLLPQVSVDYSVIRLFQQTLVITALPVVVGAVFLFSLIGKYKRPGAVFLVVIIFWHLSGFTPQLLGGFRPQTSLNNSGAYYKFFVSHHSERTSAAWFEANRQPGVPVQIDTNATNLRLGGNVKSGLIDLPDKDTCDCGYLYTGYVNTNNNVYRLYLDSDLAEYSDPDPTKNRDLLYSNNGSRVYSPRN